MPSTSPTVLAARVRKAATLPLRPFSGRTLSEGNT